MLSFQTLRPNGKVAAVLVTKLLKRRPWRGSSPTGNTLDGICWCGRWCLSDAADGGGFAFLNVSGALDRLHISPLLVQGRQLRDVLSHWGCTVSWGTS